MPMSNTYAIDDLYTNKLYSLKEVAEILRVSERSVFRYIHSGKLRASKIGYWRIAESDLKEFLFQNFNVFQGALDRELRSHTKQSKTKKSKRNKK